MRDFQRLLYAEERSNGTHHYSRHVDHQLELTEFQDVVIDGSAIPDRILDGFEIVIQNHNLSRFLGCLCTASHGKAHIRSLKSRRIINAVSGHSHYQIHFLTKPYHPGFIRWKRTRNYPDLRNDLFHLIIGHFIQLCRSQRPFRPAFQKTCVFCNGNCRLQAVSGYHNHLNACISHFCNCIPGLRPHVIADRHKADDH